MEVLSDSIIGYDSSLAIFQKPLQDVGIRGRKIIQHLPVNDFTSQGVLQFVVNSAGSNYIDLSKTLLNIRCKIVKQDGSPITKYEENLSGVWVPADSKGPMKNAEGSEAADKDKDGDGDSETHKDDGGKDKPICTGVINNFLNSLFNRVDFSVNNHLMTNSHDTYSYQSYLKTVLHAPAELRDGALETQLYYKGMEKQRFTNDWPNTDDTGLFKRSVLFNGSQEVDMSGKLACDVFDLNRLLPNNIQLQLTLYPSTPEFCLISAQIPTPTDLKIVITRASLEICHVEVSPEVIAAHSAVLLSEPAIYPFIKTEVKKFAMAKGSYGVEINNPFENRVPSELICGIVDAEACHGSMNSDPLNFENCKLTFIQATCNGQDMTNSPIYTKFGNSPHESMYVDAYKSLCGVNGIPGAIPFDRQTYFYGYTLYRFVMEDEDGTGEVIPLKRMGNVRLNLKLAEQLDRAKTVILFASFPSGFRLDRNRSIHEF